MIDIINLNESKAGDINNIIHSSAHIYSHLMKFNFVKPKLKGWVITIRNQSNQLSEITNASYWREVTGDPIKLERIKRTAIAEYKKDGNPNGEIHFNVIYNDFYDITKFRDKDLLKNYLLKRCELDKDDDMYDHVVKKFEEDE